LVEQLATLLGLAEQVAVALLALLQGRLDALVLGLYALGRRGFEASNLLAHARQFMDELLWCFLLIFHTGPLT
jgi:hypothetical protein